MKPTGVVVQVCRTLTMVSGFDKKTGGSVSDYSKRPCTQCTNKVVLTSTIGLLHRLVKKFRELAWNRDVGDS